MMRRLPLILFLTSYAAVPWAGCAGGGHGYLAASSGGDSRQRVQSDFLVTLMLHEGVDTYNLNPDKLRVIGVSCRQAGKPSRPMRHIVSPPAEGKMGPMVTVLIFVPEKTIPPARVDVETEYYGKAQTIEARLSRRQDSGQITWGLSEVVVRPAAP